MKVPVDISMLSPKSDFILCMKGGLFHCYSLFSGSLLDFKQRELLLVPTAADTLTEFSKIP